MGFGSFLQFLTFFDVVINLILSQHICGSAGTKEVDRSSSLGKYTPECCQVDIGCPVINKME